MLRLLRGFDLEKSKWMHVMFIAAYVIAATVMIPASGFAEGNATDTLIDLSNRYVEIHQPLPNTNGINPVQRSLTVGFGSGAFHAWGDAPEIFYTITDRGPVISCRKSKKYLDKKKLCRKKGKNDTRGKLFLQTNYAPTLYKIQLHAGASSSLLTAEIREATPLTDAFGNPVTGLPNPLTAATRERAYDRSGSRIKLTPSGIDPEALARLSDGTYWVSDEYGPSLVHIAHDGQILERIAPNDIADDLSEAPYRVIGGLPDVLQSRKLNRGIEALAISADESVLYFALQSPLANPNAKAFRASRHIRVYQYELNNGRLGNSLGEYVYNLDKPKKFTNPSGKRPDQSNISVTDMAGLTNGEVLVLESSRSMFKIYKIDFVGASNILDSELSNSTSGKKEIDSLEQTPHLSENGIYKIDKQLVYSSVTDVSFDPSRLEKAEGLAVLDNHHILVTNDNDFGINGAISTGYIIQIINPLYL